MPDPTAVEHGQPTGEDAQKFAELFLGYRVSQALYVMAELGIADLLENGPRDSDDLARATETHAPTLYRVLRFLAAHGVLEEVVPRRFALTSLGAMLRSDVRGSRRASIRLLLLEAHWQPWGHLLQTVRTGETAFGLVHGMTSFDYFDQHPEVAVLFSQAMSTAKSFSGAGAALAYDFATIGTLVDVGGSRGQLLAAILGRYPHLRGVLFDRPAAISTAPALFAEAGIADRCEIVPGNFFETVPSGGDAYILRHILHDWDDQRCTAILKVCHAVLAPDAKLLIIERTEPEDAQIPPSVLHADLEMLVNVGGQERTRRQYAALLAAADFRLTDAIPTGEQPPHTIYEAIPV